MITRTEIKLTRNRRKNTKQNTPEKLDRPRQCINEETSCILRVSLNSVDRHDHISTFFNTMGQCGYRLTLHDQVREINTFIPRSQRSPFERRKRKKNTKI